MATCWEVNKVDLVTVLSYLVVLEAVIFLAYAADTWLEWWYR